MLAVAFSFCVIAGGGDSPWHVNRCDLANMPGVPFSLGTAGARSTGRHSNANAAGITTVGTSWTSGQRSCGRTNCSRSRFAGNAHPKANECRQRWPTTSGRTEASGLCSQTRTICRVFAAAVIAEKPCRNRPNLAADLAEKLRTCAASRPWA